GHEELAQRGWRNGSGEARGGDRHQRAETRGPADAQGGQLEPGAGQNVARIVHDSDATIPRDMGRLDGRVALVTGAGRGFGRAIALAFGLEGADVAVNYNTSAAGAKEVVAEIERLGRR